MGFLEIVCKGCGEDVWVGAGELLGFVISQNLPVAGEIHKLHRNFACCLNSCSCFEKRCVVFWGCKGRPQEHEMEWDGLGMEHSRAAVVPGVLFLCLH